jgi:hypothetical protein
MEIKMSKPLVHANNSVKLYGGKVEDYLPIHELMDSSKAALGDKRHRAATHNSWFIHTILPKIFGSVLTNSDGVSVSITQIGEDHVTEDFGGKFIPTLEDFLMGLNLEPWMDNGNGYPPSLTNLLLDKKDLDLYEQISPIMFDGSNVNPMVRIMSAHSD